MDIRGRNKINPNFNMSSMTDIVFLLLIFFMITSTLVTTSALDILLPKASGKTENRKSVSVSITKKLDFYIDQKKVIARIPMSNDIFMDSLNGNKISADLLEIELKDDQAIDSRNTLDALLGKSDKGQTVMIEE